MKIRISYLACFLFLCPSYACYGHSVKIRIVSASDGQPLKNQPVSVSLLYEKTEKAPPNLEPVLRLETDVNGQASFLLPEPAPTHLGVQVHLTSNNWRCACSALVDTRDLIRSGIAITEPNQKPTTTPIKTQPGEILFTPRPLTFFERILEPFVKQ